MARVLASRGLRAGDRLVVQLPNGLEFLDLFLACLRLGVIFVPVSVLYREREVGHIVGDAEPVAVVTTTNLAGLAPPERRCGTSTCLPRCRPAEIGESGDEDPPAGRVLEESAVRPESLGMTARHGRGSSG